MNRFSALLLALLLIANHAPARELREVPRLAEHFKAKDVVGTFVMFDPRSDVMFVSNAARAQQRFVPASTFKVPNAAIALELGTVSGADEVVPYGGKPQRLKQWEKDMNLRDAMKASSVPVFQELARRAGLDRMRAAVREFRYGNMEVGNVVDRFWLDGPLMISAVEQAEFLKRLTTGELPVKPETVRTVKEITLLEKTPTYALHGKTGWYSPDDGGQQIGWWVGWVERDGEVLPFALNIDITADEDAPKRISIAHECLKSLGKM